MVANVLGENPAIASRVNACVLTEPALDLEASSNRVKNSLFGFYDRVFCMSFKEFMAESNSISVMKQEF